MDLFMSFLIFILLGFMTWQTLRRIEQWEHMKENLDQIICVKKFHNQTRELIKDMGLMNQIISAETMIQAASIFFPSTWIAQGHLKKIKEATKALQRLRLLSYLKDIGKAYLDKCPLDPRSLRTPFKIQGLKLKRNSLGMALFRENTWSLCFPLRYQVICTKMAVNSALDTNLSTETKVYFLPRLL